MTSGPETTDRPWHTLLREAVETGTIRALMARLPQIDPLQAHGRTIQALILQDRLDEAVLRGLEATDPISVAFTRIARAQRGRPEDHAAVLSHPPHFPHKLEHELDWELKSCELYAYGLSLMRTGQHGRALEYLYGSLTIVRGLCLPAVEMELLELLRRDEDVPRQVNSRQLIALVLQHAEDDGEFRELLGIAFSQLVFTGDSEGLYDLAAQLQARRPDTAWFAGVVEHLAGRGPLPQVSTPPQHSIIEYARLRQIMLRALRAHEQLDLSEARSVLADAPELSTVTLRWPGLTTLMQLSRVLIAMLRGDAREVATTLREPPESRISMRPELFALRAAVALEAAAWGYPLPTELRADRLWSTVTELYVTPTSARHQRTVSMMMLRTMPNVAALIAASGHGEMRALASRELAIIARGEHDARVRGLRLAGYPKTAQAAADIHSGLREQGGSANAAVNRSRHRKALRDAGHPPTAFGFRIERVTEVITAAMSPQERAALLGRLDWDF